MCAMPELGQSVSDIIDYPLTLRWMAELLYPDRMTGSFRAQLRRAYEDVYGYIPSDKEIDAILRTDVNSASIGYTRFSR